MKDLRFANELLRIRTKSSLTQAMVAQQIGVSVKSLQKWEGGYACPTTPHIQKLISLFLISHAFEPGRELEEAEAFWQLMTKCSRRKHEPFDEKWFRSLLMQPTPLHPGLPFFSSPHTFPRTQFRRGVWDDAVVNDTLYGRQQELAQMQQWIVEEAVPLVVILGMGGIGKSALSIALSRRLAQQHQFEYVFWFSLQNPSLERLMTRTLQIIAADQQIPLLQEALSSFCDTLTEHRCLLILDNFDTLLTPGTGTFRSEYQDYAQLLSLFLSHRHHSCLLITSREAIPLDALMVSFPVRQIRLKGLDVKAGCQLLAEKRLLGRDEYWQELIARYGGNPLALRMAAQEIHELFEGDIAEFLHQNVGLFRGVRELLSGQIERLPVLAHEVLYWLAIEAAPLGLNRLRKKFLHPVPTLLDQIKFLWEHNLVEHGEREAGTTFILQPIIREFLTEQIIEQVVREVDEQASLYVLTHFALLEPRGKEYLRVNQVQTFLTPILDRLRVRHNRQYTVDQRLQRLLSILRSMPPDEQGYGGGNILNLLAILNGQLHRIDASGLVIRQGYFCHTPIHDAQFTQADLRDSLFGDSADIINTIALNASGAIVLGGDNAGQICAWRIEDATLLFSLKKHDRMAWSLQFHPTQDNLFCSAGYEGVIYIWDLSRSDVIATLTGHTKWIESLCFAPDGKLASCSLDGTIRIWDVEKRKCLHVLSAPGETMRALAFSPDGILVSGTEAGMIFWWDMAHERPFTRFFPHTGTIFSLAFSPDGQLLASGGGENRVHIYRRNKLLYTLGGHAQRVLNLSFPTTHQLVTASYDSVRIWSLDEEQQQARCLWALKGSGWITSISMPPSTTRFAIGHHDGSVSVWQFAQENTFYPIRTFQGFPHKIGAVRWSHHGYLARASHGQITLWEPSSRQIIRTFSGHGCVHDLDFSSDGQLLISGSSFEERPLVIWDVKSGQCLRPLENQGDTIWSLRFSPDDRFFATSDEHKSVRIWNSFTGQCLSVLSGFDSFVWSMAFRLAGNETILACGEFSGRISLWNLEDNQRYQSIVMPSPDPITALAFRFDGMLLVVNNSILCSCYDQTGQCLWTIPAEKRFEDWVTAVTFSHDATLLARVNQDEIQIWSVATRRQIQHFPTKRYQGQIWSMDFSPDGKQLASGDVMGTVALWDISTGVCLDVLRLAKRPYERMNITHAKLTDSQHRSLLALGAIEQPDV